jgi:prepilin-type N-terminal cleavage/methylation domain-containing protein
VNRCRRIVDASRTETPLSQRGFTLIELMIVVAIIAIIASMAVPNLMASGSAANEAATAATMRTLSTAQFRFKTMAFVDADNNGVFEFGTLPELAGVAMVRGLTETVQPPLISSSMGQIDANGSVARQGYFYRLFLPDAAGVGLAAVGGALAAIDARNAESSWALLAWPSAYGKTGRAAFFVNQQGDILKTVTARYSGNDSMPPPGAALTGVAANQIVGGSLAAGVIGADGNLWLPLR